MSKRKNDRRGIAVVLTAIALVAIIGIAAIALDGGLMLDNRQRVQAAADAAAMAAAVDLFSQYQSGGNGLDSAGTAKTSALTTASANGFNNDGVNSVVTVNVPPKSGNFVGKAGYAEIIVQVNQKRGLSGIFGSNSLPVVARTVARGQCGNVGIMLLDPSLTVTAQICTTIDITNGGQIYCNSNSSVENDEFKGYGNCGGVYLESTANLTCGGINVVGKLSEESGASLTYTNGGSLQTGVGPWADPLANIPEPTPSGTDYGNKNATGTETLQPGIYQQITIGSNANVTMAPGIYYISNGMNFQNGGNLTGSGVMIYNTDGKDNFNFQNAGSINLSPPTSGTYQGISFWQPRSVTQEVHIESSNNVTMSGTIYAASGEFDLRPDGASTVFSFGNYICDQAEWGQGYSNNKSNGTIVMNPSTAASTLRPLIVE